jgi:CRP/FNR family cyclic AMP-dependent transcriptional regulator
MNGRVRGSPIWSRKPDGAASTQTNLIEVTVEGGQFTGLTHLPARYSFPPELTFMADFIGYITHMRVAEMIGYIAASLVFVTFSMKIMVPLRIVGICSNIFFIAYGYLNPAYPLLVLHCLLLPLNVLRLRQMQSLVKETKEAFEGDLDMNWIKPFTTTRAMAPGEVLFRKGDAANEIIFIMSGSLRIPELGISIPPGEVVGELGMLSPDRVRTQSAVCVDGGQMLIITYDQVRQLFFQNPKFGYYFMQLSARRLFENLKRTQSEIETLRAKRPADAFRPAEP